MVDFDSDQTISTPPSDILKILILQRREYVIDCLQDYYVESARGGHGRTQSVVGSVRSLFLQIQASLKRTLGSEDYDSLFRLVYSDDVDNLQTAFLLISEFLDRKNITKVDTRKNIDTDDVEEENRSHEM